LLGQLAEVAAANGIQVFEAEVVAANHAMLNVFRASGFPEDALLRVSAMVEDIPQISELDCNPLVVNESGAVILDARVRIAAVEPRLLFGIRR
jgi:hypothetical protein